MNTRSVYFPELIDIEGIDTFDDFIRSHDIWSARVAQVLRISLAMQVRTSFGCLIVHPSTRPGYAYQITSLDLKSEPMGHTDCKDLPEAAKELCQRAHFTAAVIVE
jgi:hypothetical protein